MYINTHYSDMADIEANHMRTGVLLKEDKIPKKTCDPECDRCIVEPTCDDALNQLNKSYESWYTLGFHTFSALSIGTTVLSALTINGVVSLLSCNSVFSILSLNSAFSILSTNSAFAIGCVDKRFKVCF